MVHLRMRLLTLLLSAMLHSLAFKKPANFIQKLSHRVICLRMATNQSTNFIHKTLAISLFTLVTSSISPALAKEELPPLEKCFAAVERELSPQGESLIRLSKDIKEEKWDDIKLFTREYDAGFRGYVLKSAWRQMNDDSIKKKGIEISNSFTFDLIALNKASRVKDANDAQKRLVEIRQDLRNFLSLREVTYSTNVKVAQEESARSVSNRK